MVALTGPGGLGACASHGTVQPAAALPPLWRIDPQPRAPAGGWLFGSIHAGLERDEPWPPELARAWQAADMLAIEIDVGARRTELRSGFAAAARLPAGMTIESLVGERAADEIRRLGDFGPERWERLRRLAPWALASILAGQDRSAGENRDGVEARLLASAQARALPVAELEQVAEQVDALAGSRLEAQAAWLLHRVATLRQGDATAAAVVAAWRTGDTARLARLKARLWGDADGPQAEVRERMFALRERRMADRLATLLATGRAAFTAVGAFHVVGPDALPVILEGHGIRCRRIVRRETGIRDDT